MIVCTKSSFCWYPFEFSIKRFVPLPFYYEHLKKFDQKNLYKLLAMEETNSQLLNLAFLQRCFWPFLALFSRENSTIFLLWTENRLSIFVLIFSPFSVHLSMTVPSFCQFQCVLDWNSKFLGLFHWIYKTFCSFLLESLTFNFRFFSNFLCWENVSSSFCFDSSYVCIIDIASTVDFLVNMNKPPLVNIVVGFHSFLFKFDQICFS